VCCSVLHCVAVNSMRLNRVHTFLPLTFVLHCVAQCDSVIAFAILFAGRRGVRGRWGGQREDVLQCVEGGVRAGARERARETVSLS